MMSMVVEQSGTYVRFVGIDNTMEEIKKQLNMPLRYDVKWGHYGVQKANFKNGDTLSDLDVVLETDGLRKVLFSIGLQTYSGAGLKQTTENGNDIFNLYIGGIWIYLGKLSDIYKDPTNPGAGFSNPIFEDIDDPAVSVEMNMPAMINRAVLKNLQNSFKLKVISDDIGKVMSEHRWSYDDYDMVLEEVGALVVFLSHPSHLSTPLATHLLLVFNEDKSDVYVYYLPDLYVYYNATTDATPVPYIEQIVPDYHSGHAIDSFKLCDSKKIRLSIELNDPYDNNIDGSLLFIGHKQAQSGTPLPTYLYMHTVAIGYTTVEADLYKL